MTVKTIAIKKIINQKSINKPISSKSNSSSLLPEIKDTTSHVKTNHSPKTKSNVDLSYQTKKLLEKMNSFQLNEKTNDEKSLSTNAGQLVLDLSDEEEEEIVKAMRSQHNVLTNSKWPKFNESRLTTVTSIETVPMFVDAYEQTSKLLDKIKETRERSVSGKPTISNKSTFQRSLTSRIRFDNSSTNNKKYGSLASRIPKSIHEPISNIYRTKSTTDALTQPTSSTVVKKNNRTTTMSNSNPPVRGKSVINDNDSKRLSLSNRYFSTKLPLNSINKLNETSESIRNSKSVSNMSKNNNTLDSIPSISEITTTRTSRLRLLSNKKNYDFDNITISNNNKKSHLYQKRHQTSTPHHLNKSFNGSVEAKETIIGVLNTISSSSEEEEEEKEEIEGEGTITLNFDLPNDVDPSNVNVLLDENNENLIIESGDKKDNYYVISLPKNTVFDDLEYKLEKLNDSADNKDLNLIKKDFSNIAEPALNLELSMNIDLEKEIDPSKIRVTLNEDNIIVESKELNDVIYAVSLPENTDFDRMEYSLEKLNSSPSSSSSSNNTVRTISKSRTISTTKSSSTSNNKLFKKIQI